MILNISSRAIFNDFQRSIYHVYAAGGGEEIHMRNPRTFSSHFQLLIPLMQHGNKLPMFRVITRQNCSTTDFNIG